MWTTEVGPIRPSQSDPFPMLVTTPSDAQGRKGSTERNAISGLTTEAQPSPVPDSTGANPLVSYAAAVQHGRTQERRGRVKPPANIAGTWSPRERKLLLSTLAQDWEASSTPVDTPEQALLRTVALAPSKVHANNALRERSKPETDTLLQYLDKTLELPHPPNFAKATLPLLQRAMLEQFHEKHCEVMLTADISPRARLRRSMTHNSIFAQLHAANADSAAGRSMIARLLEDVKRLHFDGLHTLTFVSNSERIAQLYLGIALRLNGTCIELEDTTDDPDSGTYRQARLRRQYSVRVYGVDDLGLVVLLAALGRLGGVDVVDAERSRVGASEIVDNGYFLLRFNTDTCPDMLRGVTKLKIHGRLITLHHHVIYQRLPCTRCYAPYHTTGFCKAKPGQVITQQAKFLRTYRGPLPSYHVGTATQYRHTDEESLTTFLTTLHQELTGETVVTGEGAIPPPVAELLRTEREPDQPHSPLTHVTESARASAEDGSGATAADTPRENNTDGFTVVTRRQRRNRSGESHTPAERGPASGTADGSTTGAQRPGAKTAAAPSATKSQAAASARRAFPPTATNGRPAGATARPKAKNKATAYAKFKQDHAMGRYTLLADPEEDGTASSDVDAQDEAPYAYPPPSPEAAPAAIEELRRSLHTGGSATPRRTGHEESSGSSQSPAAAEVQLRDDETVLSSYLGSSPPSSPRSPATTPGSSAPFSLVSGQELSTSPMEVDTHEPETEADGTDDLTEDMATNGVAEDPSLSQDGFSIERVKLAPGMPQQLPVFLLPFQGALTTVPANGQCAYAALYATMTTLREPKLNFTPDVVKGANAVKRSIYTLMLANLAHDVACNVVDSCHELKRLYPSQPAPTDMAAATAALYTHYTQERTRTVNSPIPSDFWVGPEVLRAMAQYLREPIFVLDVNQHNDAHVQRYYYSDYTLPNGDVHETGCGGAMDDTTAKTMLGHYARLHVMPVFLVLKRHEGHFYGVNHGEIATKWQAEGDLAFTQENCVNHSWYPDVVAHIEYSQGLLAQVDFLNDDEATNTIIIGAMERRARLDVVHDRLNLGRMDRDPYDIAILDGVLKAEADKLHALAGTGGGSAHPTGTIVAPDGDSARRNPISAQGKVARSTLERILDAINADPELVSDRAKLRHLNEENLSAIKVWLRRGHTQPRQPQFHGGTDDFLPLMTWLVMHRTALHDLLQFVPYPELIAKFLPREMLLRWGELELYDLQIATMRQLVNHEEVPIPAKEYCRSWVAACTTEDGSTRDRQLAKDPQRWLRLRGLYTAAPMCSCPPGVAEDCWRVLHTLPHVVWAWSVTPWGTYPRTQLGSIYQVHPAVQQACEKIVDKDEWGATVMLPSGVTWEDRLVAMATGLAATAQY